MKFQTIVALALLLCSTFIVGEAQLLRRAKDAMLDVAEEDQKIRGLRYSDASMDHHYSGGSGSSGSGGRLCCCC